MVIFATIVGAILLLGAGGLFDSNDPYGFMLLVGGLFFLWGAYNEGTTRAHKVGQIECYTGTMYYELQENPDKTKEWVKKDSVEVDPYWNVH